MWQNYIFFWIQNFIIYFIIIVINYDYDCPFLLLLVSTLVDAHSNFTGVIVANWTEVVDGPSARDDHAMAPLSEGRVLMYGGYDDNNNYIIFVDLRTRFREMPIVLFHLPPSDV